jgi:hypothetical protein
MLVLTPSPTALRSPLSPKGARVEIFRGQFSVVSPVSFWRTEVHEYMTKTKNSSSLSPLGERGDRKAVGEGVERLCANQNSLGFVIPLCSLP